MFIKYEIIMSKNMLKASRISFFNDFLNHYLQNIKCQSKISIAHNYRMLRINEIRIRLHTFVIHAEDLYIYNILSCLILFEKQNCKVTVIFNRFIFAFLFFVYHRFSFSCTHIHTHAHTHTHIAISGVIAAKLRD